MGTLQPLSIRPITDGTQTATVYDPNVRSPYIQSLTMALTRQIGSSLTIDVRYIGTLSRKQIGTINLNANNWINNGLKEAFDAARAGGESALLNELIPTFCIVQPVSAQTVAQRHYLPSTALATGNYNEVANVLTTSNGRYPELPSGVQGALIRKAALERISFPPIRSLHAANWTKTRNHTNYHSMQAQATLRPTHGLSFHDDLYLEQRSGC